MKICALATGVKTKITKNNKMMAFVTAEDLTGQAEILVFPNVYERCKQYLTEDAPIVISGRLSFREDEEPKILCDAISPLEHGMKPPAGEQKLFMKFELGKDFLIDRAKAIWRSTQETCLHIFLWRKKI